MEEGKIIEKGIPKSIYDNPNSKYIASLFGDVNEIEIDGKLQLVYPNQLIIVESSKIKVDVLKCYFLGSHYLIESKYNNQILFLESENEIAIGSILYLKKKP